MHGGGDDHGVGQLETLVACPKPCGNGGDIGIQRHHPERNSIDETPDRVDRLLTATTRTDQDLGEGRCREHQLVAAAAGGVKGDASCLVVGVVGVEKSDEDAGIEHAQSHSARSVASSSAS